MKLTMRLGVRSYDIIIKQGGLSRVGQLINLNRRVLVVSDTGVPEAYLKTVLAQCREGVPVVLPQGEGTKSQPCRKHGQSGAKATSAALGSPVRTRPPPGLWPVEAELTVLSWAVRCTWRLKGFLCVCVRVRVCTRGNAAPWLTGRV